MIAGRERDLALDAATAALETARLRGYHVGVAVTDRHQLTALPEYRNGGLLLDTGVLQLVDAADSERTWDVGDEIIVEWRALTITLLDELALRVRAHLDAPSLPLACILEGGTWAAGRKLAAELRGGKPPLAIDSDGTVF